MTKTSATRNAKRQRTFSVVLPMIAFFALGAVTTHSQTRKDLSPSNDKRGGIDIQSYTDANSDAEAVTHMGASASPKSAVAIDGSGNLPLERTGESTWAILTGFFGGYDSALQQKQGLSTGIAGNELDIAGLINGKKGVFLLQNSTTTTSLLRDGITLMGLNRTSLDFVHDISPRWSWNARGSAGYGNDTVRALTSADRRPVDSISVPTPDAAAYGFRTGKVLTADANVSVQHRTSRTGEIRFAVSDTYQNYYDLNMSVNTSQVRTDYIRTFSRSYSHGIYGAFGRQTGTVDCTVGGGGYQALLHPGKSFSIEAYAGPLFGTSACGRTLEFSAGVNLFDQLTPQTSVYFSAERQLNDGVLQNAVWMNTVIGGMRHAFNSRLDARTDVGGFQGKSQYSQNKSANSSYYNMFISGGLRYALTPHIDQELTFRHYISSGFPSSPDRTFVLYTLWFTPGRHAQGKRY